MAALAADSVALVTVLCGHIQSAEGMLAVYEQLVAETVEVLERWTMEE